jgi:hypothetical protein
VLPFLFPFFFFFFLVIFFLIPFSDFVFWLLCMRLCKEISEAPLSMSRCRHGTRVVRTAPGRRPNSWHQAAQIDGFETHKTHKYKQRGDYQVDY